MADETEGVWRHNGKGSRVEQFINYGNAEERVCQCALMAAQREEGERERE